MIRADYGSKRSSNQGLLVLPPPLSIIIKDGVHVVNFHEYSDIGTHWIILYSLSLFWINILLTLIALVQNTFQKKLFINNKTIKTNIFRIQAQDSVMCGYFCIIFLNFMLEG